jgi:dolichyl-phosphate-mannose-protein mannosyltransferase
MSRRLERAFARPEVWCLTAISAVLHFWRLFTPNAIVFDEAYFTRFTGYYLSGSYMFDVHPPLGRLMYAALARVLDIPAAALLRGQSEPVLRILPAAFGVALVPLVYLMLRQLRASRKVATLAAAAIALENALLVDTRLELTDIFLIVFGYGAMTAYLAARVRDGRVRFALISLSALLAGCAFSVKWTGASAFGLILLAWFMESIRAVRVDRRSWRRAAREGIAFLLIPAAVYLGTFAIHFAVLTHDGPGAKDMSAQFRRQLAGSGYFNAAAPKLSYWEKLGEVHHAIKYGNGYLQNASNGGASPWYTWPIMKHPIGLWEGVATPGEKAALVLLGNPFVWWGGMIGVLVGIALFVVRRSAFAGYEYGFLFLLGAVGMNYVPFMAIKRLMYLYHYLFALVLVVSCATYVAGLLGGWMSDDGGLWRFPSRRSAVVYWGILVMCAVGFIYFLPFTYGFHQTVSAYDRRFWMLHPTF